MPMPTEPVDGATPSQTDDPTAGTTGGPTSGPAPAPTSLALVREVQGPTGDRGRVAGLAMVCSAAGVALGFALAGSLFAAMAPPPTNVGPAGWSSCPSHRYRSLGPGHHAGGFHTIQQPAARPFLGVEVDARSTAAPVLAKVIAGTPAALAGLRPGDRVIRFAGEEVDSGKELVQLIRARQPGEVVSLDAVGEAGRAVSIPALRLAALPVR